MKFLLSDDNTKVFEPWKDRASKFDIELACFSNWEEAQYELEEHWNDYEFVILDGKGKLFEDSPSANNKHVIASVQWMKEQKGKGKYKPLAIYTGYFENVDDIVIKDDQILEIFDKEKTSIDDVLIFALQNIKNSPLQILRAKHPNIYELINSNLLTADRKKDLQNIFSEIQTDNEDNYIDTFRKIRPILECMIVRLKQIDNSLLPERLFNIDDPDISKCIKHLAGDQTRDSGTGKYFYKERQHMPVHIYYVADYLQKSTSKGAMHHYDNKISKYFVQSCAYALNELLIWYKDFIKRNYHN